MLNTYVPEGAIIFMTCSAESGPDPYWLIDDLYLFLVPSSTALLNERGFYEIDSPQDDPHIIQLAINSTHNINGTSIKCIDVTAETKTVQTTMVVYGKQDLEERIRISNKLSNCFSCRNQSTQCFSFARHQSSILYSFLESSSSSRG